MKQKNRMIVASVVASVVGWNAHATLYPPSVPERDRPVAKLVSRLARLALFVSFFAQSEPPHEHQVKTGVGSDGFPVLDHGRSL